MVLTIRNVDPQLKARLRMRAARNERSMEEEVRAILRDALPAEQEETGADLADRIRALFSPLGGFEMPELPEDFVPDPPRLKR
jgi:plasmid stability protein